MEGLTWMDLLRKSCCSETFAEFVEEKKSRDGEKVRDTQLMFLIWLLILSPVALFFSIIRNNWVFKESIRLIREDHKSYKRLPSYHYLVLCFWVWAIKKFMKDKNESK